MGVLFFSLYESVILLCNSDGYSFYQACCWFAFTKMEHRLVGLFLTKEEDEELILNVTPVEKRRILFELCLVGRFLTEKIVNFNAMKNRMATL